MTAKVKSTPAGAGLPGHGSFEQNGIPNSTQFAKYQPGTSAAKRKAVRAYLDDPELARLSNREIARRCGTSHVFVGKLRSGSRGAVTRAVTTSRGQEGPVGGGNGPVEAAAAAPRVFPRRTKAFEPPALNSLDCWVLATPEERTKFVDAVGLNALYATAPEDHRAAFLARRWCELEHKPEVEPPPEMQVYVAQIGLTLPGEVPDVPDFLRRYPKLERP